KNSVSTSACSPVMRQLPVLCYRRVVKSEQIALLKVLPPGRGTGIKGLSGWRICVLQEIVDSSSRLDDELNRAVHRSLTPDDLAAFIGLPVTWLFAPPPAFQQLVRIREVHRLRGRTIGGLAPLSLRPNRSGRNRPKADRCPHQKDANRKTFFKSHRSSSKAAEHVFVWPTDRVCWNE